MRSQKPYNKYIKKTVKKAVKSKLTLSLDQNHCSPLVKQTKMGCLPSHLKQNEYLTRNLYLSRLNQTFRTYQVIQNIFIKIKYCLTIYLKKINKPSIKSLNYANTIKIISEVYKICHFDLSIVK